jgi:hypothetical protein
MGRSAYGLGNSFRWCVVSFRALGLECRVLVVLNPAKEKFEAILGAMGSSGLLRVLCSYEYHASEPGWHVYAACDEISGLPVGYMRGPHIRRMPGARATHSRLDFHVKTESAAQHFAFEVYNIKAQGTLI